MRSVLILTAFWVASIHAETTYLRPMLGFDEAAPLSQKATIEATTYKKGTRVGGMVTRRLQPTTTLINALINVFAPNLEQRVEMEANKLDPTNLNYAANDPQGEVALNFNQTWCNETTAEASIQYKLGSMSGLASMDVTRLELEGGSENINLQFQGLTVGATWSGVWIMEASFTQFNTATVATLSNTFCNFTFEEILSGNALLSSPSVAGRIYMEGSTGSVFDFQGTSQLTSATIRDMNMAYGTMTPGLGSFGGMVTLDADQPLVDIAQAGLTGDLKAQIQKTIQDGISGAMPIPF